MLSTPTRWTPGQARKVRILIIISFELVFLYSKIFRVPDIYHTCYTLSGLSIAQHSPQSIIIGQTELNLVQKIHPIYNLVFSTALNAIEHFTALSLPD